MSFCCDHDANCCNSGLGRFNLLPSNPTTSATWDVQLTRFVVLSPKSTITPTTQPPSLSTTPTKTTITSATSEPSSTLSSSSSQTSEQSTRAIGGLLNSDPSSTLSSTPSSTGSGPTGTSTNIQVPKSSTGLSPGIKAAIGASIVGTALIAALFGYVIWRLRAVNKAFVKYSPSSSAHPNMGNRNDMVDDSKAVVPMYAQPFPSELDNAASHRSELDDYDTSGHKSNTYMPSNTSYELAGSDYHQRK